MCNIKRPHLNTALFLDESRLPRYHHAVPADRHFSRWLPAAFFASVGALFALHMFAYVDPDLFFHLKEGEKLILQGRFPVFEEFSFTAPGKAMVAIEWLADAEMYLVFRASGYAGLVVFHTLLFLAALAVLFRFLRDDVGPEARYLLVSLAAFALLNFVGVRAHVFTILFMSLYLLWAKLWEEGRRWAPWAMAAGLLLWVNLHGGFMLGWVLLGLVCLLEFRQTLRLADLTPWASGTLLCFVHPNGAAAFVYPIWFMALPPSGRSMIIEWKPLDFSQLCASPYLLILGALCWAGLEIQRRKFPWALLTLLLMVLALRSRKLLSVFSLTALAVAGLRLRQATLQGWQSRLCATGALSILLAMGCLEWSFARDRPWRDWESNYPKAAVEFFASRYPGRRLFHTYTWGGYLIYKLAPGTKVFIDGRLDPYWSLLAGDYNDIMEGRPGWKETLDAWGIEAALLPPTTRPAHRLNEDPRWQPVYSDEKAVLFLRRRQHGRAQPSALGRDPRTEALSQDASRAG